MPHWGVNFKLFLSVYSEMQLRLKDAGTEKKAASHDPPSRPPRSSRLQQPLCFTPSASLRRRPMSTTSTPISPRIHSSRTCSPSIRPPNTSSTSLRM
ncbi:hypothetical protein GUJ93_ZPchr0006g45288 [Zizania palustris]|uniref:Uncharacterized protein n=1 Tax=Zizania palustris TaxID=103762 RepID=A0A8J5W529_ZIZPA|nr:hypothetical protein GUJ93_ZPchr0006g45288 [Zizania palustris]